MDKQTIINEIVEQAKKLKLFTYEELIDALKHIPECKEKEQCIEWFLDSPSIIKHFHFFYYS